ncbi:MAG TPA: hypothetical protein VGK20_18705 [Candidatus Binatia bacterium]|jgi:hypothetical protein
MRIILVAAAAATFLSGAAAIVRTKCRAAAVVAILLAAHAPCAFAALCGDTSGDGYFTATDALKTLQLAVAGAYDRRGDVFPVTGSGAGDGKLGATDALVTLKAAVAGTIPPCHGADAHRAVVTTAAADFSSAGLAVMDVASRSFTFRAGALETDSVIRAPQGIPVVVNRNGYDTLQYLDVDDPLLPNEKECSVSGGFDSNTQDVAFVSTQKGYVTAYAGSSLLTIDPSVLFDTSSDPACNGIVTGQIYLGDYGTNHVPQMDEMALVGSDLFVSLQLLDNLQPDVNGLLVVIDTTTDTVKTTIPLSFENPFAMTKGLPYDEFQKLLFTGGPGKIVPTHQGEDVLHDGGIEAIDPATFTSRGLVLSGADLGANIFDFVIVGSSRAFAIIADDKSNSVVDIDLSTRTVRRTVLSSTAVISDIEMTETGEVWVAYRGKKDDPAGVRIFRAGNDRQSEDAELTAKPIALGQAPFTLAFVQ